MIKQVKDFFSDDPGLSGPRAGENKLMAMIRYGPFL
jgi:hypothetical protein